MRKKLVAGNWKMNGSLQQNADLLASVLREMGGVGCDVLLCPPFPYLAQVGLALTSSGVFLGAQDVSIHDAGAFTGEVSAAMLADLGCSHVLVGHSERRALHGETNQIVAAKFEAAQRAGLIPVLCLGETLAERDAGVTERVITAQLGAVIERSGVAALERAVVAYEPVWAIGTGVTATPAMAQAAHVAIRNEVARQSFSVAERLILLYGGSVKPENAADLFSQPDIDGGLIGGASLVSGDFLAICRTAV